MWLPRRPAPPCSHTARQAQILPLFQPGSISAAEAAACQCACPQNPSHTCRIDLVTTKRTIHSQQCDAQLLTRMCFAKHCVPSAMQQLQLHVCLTAEMLQEAPQLMISLWIRTFCLVSLMSGPCVCCSVSALQAKELRYGGLGCFCIQTACMAAASYHQTGCKVLAK